jgi:hypothetical protein
VVGVILATTGSTDAGRRWCCSGAPAWSPPRGAAAQRPLARALGAHQLVPPLIAILATIAL